MGPNTTVRMVSAAIFVLLSTLWLGCYSSERVLASISHRGIKRGVVLQQPCLLPSPRFSKAVLVGQMTGNFRRMPRPSAELFTPAFEDGTSVRVKADVTVYHVPGKKGEGLKLEGMEGKVVQDVTMYRGQKLSTTLPVIVEFETVPEEGSKGKVFKAHLAEEELEAI
mmetsp:Transcript_18120/g.28883  ORF Transcript_18120/g.28883 Transcript_18120/m.28883 type:complete len:167 (+) Transcript_18120:86-586(+)